MGIKSLNIIKFLIITATKKTEIPLFGAGFCFLDGFTPLRKKRCFVSRVSILTRNTDIANLSVSQSVHYIPVLYENSLTHFLHHTVAESF